jgi:PAS domain S-box-containing protein
MAEEILPGPPLQRFVQRARVRLREVTAFLHAERTQEPQSHPSSRPIEAVALGVITGALALVILIGWAADIPILRTPRSEWMSAKPNEAVALLFCSAALLLLCKPTASSSRVALGRAAAVVVVLIGVVTLIEYLYQTGINIDQVLFADEPDAPWTPNPGRMAPSASVALVLIGLSLLLLDSATRPTRWAPEALLAIVLVIVLPRLVGYAYGLVPTGPHPYTLMGPYTAVLLGLVSLGTLAARPEQGRVSILSRNTEGGRTALQLTLASVLLPLAAGAIGIGLARAGAIAVPFVTPLAVSALIVGLVVISLAIGWQAQHLETQRESRLLRLQAQHEATRALMESMTVREARPRFLASLGQSLHWDSGALWQLSSDGKSLECAYFWTAQAGVASEFERTSLAMRLAPGVELPGLVWVSGQPAWVPNIQRSPSLRGAVAARDGLRAGFAFPVRYGNEVRGVIEFFSLQARDDDRDLLAIAPILGNQIGEALERKRAEELLRASEDRFRAVAESAIDSLVTVDGNGRITYVNPAAESMFGVSAAQIVGQPISQLLPASGVIEQALADHRAETIARLGDGGELPVELSAARWSTAEGIFTTTIVRDVSARKRVEGELRQARDAAEASNRELEAFSYSVSHDLRTPVRSVDGFSQALLEDLGDQLEPEAKENLLRVRAAAGRMSELIDSLLELSRATRAALHYQAVDLAVIAREIAEDIRARQPERRVEVLIEEPLPAWGDARLLRVVMQNLLDNAFKFTLRTPSPRVEVGVLRGGEKLVFFVRDNGSGFDMDFVNRMFLPFQRLHGEEEYPGTGIGLALVQRIIQRHGGQIWAEGEPDHGATFFFTLPGSPTAPAREQ